MHIENLQKLFVEELKDTYDAEHQLVDALQEMEQAARSPQLKRAFAAHRRETEGQVQRLEKIFRGLGEEPDRKTCKAMKGLLSEGREIAKADGDDEAVDAGIIGAAQKVEHYEIAAYGTLRTFALTLGRQAEAQLLQETLDEESATDEKLTEMAVANINPEAVAGEGDDHGNGVTGRLAGLLSSLGIRSRFGGTKTDGSGERKATGAASKSAANKSGGRKSAARKTAARRTSTSKSSATKSKARGANGHATSKRSTSRSASAKRAAARKTGRSGGASHAKKSKASRSSKGSSRGGSSRGRASRAH